MAIRVARRLAFLDSPVDKAHLTPTPYLGGAAVMAAFVVALVVSAAEDSRTGPLAVAVAVLWALGTLDDRRGVPPR